MAPKPGTKAYNQQYREVIVGWHSRSNSPRMIFVQNDGGMSGHGQMHHPVGGRTAENEAVVVFHFSQIRSFSIQDEIGRREYFEELKRMHANDKPENEDNK